MSEAREEALRRYKQAKSDQAVAEEVYLAAERESVAASRKLKRALAHRLRCEKKARELGVLD